MVKFTSFLASISLIVLILFLGIEISAFHMWFYYWQFNVNNTYEILQMRPYDLHEVARHLINYIRGNLDRDFGLQISTYVGYERRYFFSELEIKHMLDVYDLFMYGFVLRNILIAVFFVSLIYVIYKKKFKVFLKVLFISCLSTFLFLVLLSGIISINWQRALHIFHYIFFNNDYWLLNPRVDLLINMVPYPFFFAMTTFIGLFFALILILILIISFILYKKKH